jgi:hypothetical protein
MRGRVPLISVAGTLIKHSGILQTPGVFFKELDLRNTLVKSIFGNCVLVFVCVPRVVSVTVSVSRASPSRVFIVTVAHLDGPCYKAWVLSTRSIN